MRLAVVGADGRMGRELLSAIGRIDGVELQGAIVKSGSPFIGKDAGILIGQANLGVTITDDPLPVFAKVEGVLDFTSPVASVLYAGYAAQARIVHDQKNSKTLIYINNNFESDSKLIPLKQQLLSL